MTLGQWAIKSFALVVGFPILTLPCLLHAWEPCVSTALPFGRAPRTIDQWKWKWLRPWYNNPEDGVSGAHAILDWGKQTPYMPDANKPKWLPQWLWDALRAWLWSAWRNSVGQLKYTFGEDSYNRK